MSPIDDIELTERGSSARLSTSLDRPSQEELKQRHGRDWVNSGVRNDDGQEQDSEHELLLDPNLPEDFDDVTGEQLDGDEADKTEPENSPYPEVRAAVPNYDEDLPCNTIRVWVIGLCLVVFGASINTLLSLRQPSISIGALIAQIIAWPLGHGWARYMPTTRFNTLGIDWTLNPGPFNIKEHSIIVIMASVAFSVAYATDIILAQIVFYKQDFGISFQLLLTISTQSLGYGIAGMLRKYLVYPASMIWPGNLAVVTLMTAMYEEDTTRDFSVLGGSMPRYKWFALVTGVSFLYYFIPGFFAKFLSVFAFMTWIAPKNVVINQLFGGTTGLSLIPITFDWTEIAGYFGSPLVPPWHAIANTLIGVVTFYIFLASAIHYSGTWYAEYLPMSDMSTYDNTGSPYNTTRILTKDFTLDEEAYHSYSPLFLRLVGAGFYAISVADQSLSTTFAISYGLSFAAISSLIVYTYLHNRKQIWRQYRNSTTEKPDIHMKLMRKYKEAPQWWYMSLFVLMLGLGFITVLGYPTNLTWWAFLLAVAISFAFALPIGIIQAITNNQIGLNVLTEFIFGYIQPGRPLALMIFKTFGYIAMSQALNFVSDLKYGHYMKLPPRTLFLSQVVATTLSCVVQVIVLNLSLNNIDNVCDLQQADHFTCPGGRVFFAASVIWGLIGPSRMFSPGQIYSGLFVFFLIGAIVPIVIYYWVKRHPHSPARFLMAPLIFAGAGFIPPATPLNYLSWGAVGFVFQFWIKKRHFGWWRRLNFLTSSGLDLGLALATLFIFFAFTLRGVSAPSWWGNDVVDSTLDAKGAAIQAHVAEGERFGPDVW